MIPDSGSCRSWSQEILFKMKLKLISIGALLLSGLLLLAGCDKYDDSKLTGRVDELENRVTELEKLVNDLNTTVQGLSSIVTAMENEDRIQNITPLKEGEAVIGYEITFSKSGTVKILNGEEPSLGVKDEGGILYWTVDGNFLTDGSGNKIPATIAPEFRVENGELQYRVNGGEWQTMPGSANIGLIKDVNDGTESVTFVLSDGTEITIPKVQSFALELDVEETEIGIMANQVMTINYTVVSGDENTLVKAISEGGYSVKVNATDATKGYLSITAPAELPDNATILVIAVNGKGEMTGKILSFEKGELTLVENTVTVGKDGGEFTVSIKTNMTYSVQIAPDSGWITQIVETKAVRTDELKFTAEPYEGTGSRTGTIDINYGDGQKVTYTVVQTEETIVSGGKADFGTFSAFSPNVRTYVADGTSTTSGWKVNAYCVIIEEGGSGGNWEEIDGALPVLCGLKDQAGVLTSPSLDGGCGKLTIKYGTTAVGTQNVGFKFKVTVNNGTDTKEFEVDKEPTDITSSTVYEEIQDINLSGNFTVTITNLCKAPHSTASLKLKDAVGILSVEWNGYSE